MIDDKTLEIIYDGYIEYYQKHYMQNVLWGKTVPSFQQIKVWEEFRALIAASIAKKELAKIEDKTQ